MARMTAWSSVAGCVVCAALFVWPIRVDSCDVLHSRV